MQITDFFTQITEKLTFCFKPSNHGGIRDNHGWLATLPVSNYWETQRQCTISKSLYRITEKKRRGLQPVTIYTGLQVNTEEVYNL